MWIFRYIILIIYYHNLLTWQEKQIIIQMMTEVFILGCIQDLPENRELMWVEGQNAIVNYLYDG